jgi:HEAT repeat protein
MPRFAKVLRRSNTLFQVLMAWPLWPGKRRPAMNKLAQGTFLAYSVAIVSGCAHWGYGRTAQGLDKTRLLDNGSLAFAPGSEVDCRWVDGIRGILEGDYPLETRRKAVLSLEYLGCCAPSSVLPGTCVVENDAAIRTSCLSCNMYSFLSIRCETYDDPVVQTACLYFKAKYRYVDYWKRLVKLSQAGSDEDIKKWASIFIERGVSFYIAKLAKDGEDAPDFKATTLALVNIGGPAVPKLVELLDSETESVLRSAAIVLGEISSPDAIPGLVKALRWGFDLGRLVSESLAKIGTPAIPSLEQALHDESKYVRQGAAEALGRMASPAFVPSLEKALGDVDSGVRESAAQALGRIASPASRASLEKALEDKVSSVCESAAEALGKIASPASIPSLEKALGSRNARLCMRAAEALGRIASPASVPSLARALVHEYYGVRQSAAEALGRIGMPAMPVLVEALRAKDPYDRQRAARALGNVASPDSIPTLERALDDTDVGVRQMAAEALGKIASPVSVPVLIKAFGNTNIMVRFLASEALGKIGAPAIPGLVKALRGHGNGAVRYFAATALGKISSPDVMPILVEALENDDEYLVRSGAAEALGTMASSAAVPSLAKALSDQHWEVRRSASDALVKMGTPAIPILIKALGDGASDVRSLASETLGKIPSPASVPSLIKALEDKDWGVRESAAQALGKIGGPAVDDLARLVENGTKEWSYSRGSIDTNVELRYYAATALLSMDTSVTGYYLRKKALEVQAVGIHQQDNSSHSGGGCGYS